MTPTNLSLATLRVIHSICCKFESDWHEGHRPPLEPYLTQISAEHQAVLFQQLLASELEFRADAHDCFTADEYVRRFPHYEDLIGSLIRPYQRQQEEPAPLPTPAVERFGNYIAEAEIDRGGMGIVYRARDLRLGRTVALKVILPGRLSSQNDRDRFALEARAVAKLNHPGIVPIYETGEAAGHSYLVMPFIEGQNLAQELSTSPLPPRVAAERLAQIADAMECAHTAGIVHRDLKPRNILIDRQGHTHVTDFGLAKILQDELLLDHLSQEETDHWGRHTMTVTGQVIGTPHYMSPEQASGHARNVTTSADIYAMGTLLYEMTTGRPPFQGATLLETLSMIQQADPPPLRRINQHIPRDLETICLKCLEKDPLRRYPTALALQQDLDNFLAGRTVSARPVGMATMAWRWCRRNRSVAALLSLVLSLIVLLAVLASASAWRLRRERDTLMAAQTATLRAEHERREELFRVYLAEAREKPWVNGTHQRERGVESLQHALQTVSWKELDKATQDQTVDSAVPHLIYAKLVETSRWPSGMMHDDNLRPQADIHPTLAWSAIATTSNRATALQPLARQDKPPAAVSSDSTGVDLVVNRQFSPCGQWLYQVGLKRDSKQTEFAFRIQIWNTQAPDKRLLSRMIQEDTVAFHAETESIIVAQGRQLQQIHLPTGRVLAESPPRFQSPQVAFDSDGRYLLISSRDQPTQVVDMHDWHTLASFADLGISAAAAWHPHEHWSVIGATDGTLYRWTMGSHDSPRRIDRVHQQAIDRIVFSPDGQLMATCDTSHHFVVWDTQTLRVLSSGRGGVLRFLPDNRRLAVLHEYDIVLYELKPTSVVRHLPYHAMAVSYSPDGRTLGVAGSQGAKLIDLTTLSPVADLGLDTCGPIAFHPSGNSLVTFGYFSYVKKWPRSAHSLGPPQSIDSRGESTWFSLRPQHSGRIAAWSADGRWLAFADYRENRVVLWDDLHQKLHDAIQLPSPVHVAISADGRWLAATQVDQLARIWDRVEERVVWTGDQVINMGFDHLGQRCVVCKRHSTDFLEMTTWHVIASVPTAHPFATTRVPPAFRPQGDLVAVCDHERQVRLLECKQGAHVLTLDGGASAPVAWVALSPQGNQLAAASANGLALWDFTHLAEELRTLGISDDSLSTSASPQTASASREAQQPLAIDRGPLPARDRWHTYWQRLASFEATLGNWPDAIEDLTLALADAPPESGSVRATILIDRGHYHWQSLDFISAENDWKAVLKYAPGHERAIRALVKLYLSFGEQQNFAEAQRLLYLLPQPPDPTDETLRVLHASVNSHFARITDGDRATLLAALQGEFTSLTEDQRILSGHTLCRKLIEEDPAAAKEIFNQAEQLFQQAALQLSETQRHIVTQSRIATTALLKRPPIDNRSSKP